MLSSCVVYFLAFFYILFFPFILYFVYVFLSVLRGLSAQQSVSAMFCVQLVFRCCLYLCSVCGGARERVSKYITIQEEHHQIERTWTWIISITIKSGDERRRRYGNQKGARFCIYGNFLHTADTLEPVILWIRFFFWCVRARVCTIHVAYNVVCSAAVSLSCSGRSTLLSCLCVMCARVCVFVYVTPTLSFSIARSFNVMGSIVIIDSLRLNSFVSLSLDYRLGCYFHPKHGWIDAAARLLMFPSKQASEQATTTTITELIR